MSDSEYVPSDDIKPADMARALASGVAVSAAVPAGISVATTMTTAGIAAGTYVACTVALPLLAVGALLSVPVVLFNRRENK